MKPEILPFYRDGGRLYMPDPARMSLSRARRVSGRPVRYGKQAMRHQLWPAAVWWKALEFSGSQAMPESRTPGRDRAVIDSWNRLGNFSGWTAAVLADVIFVLVETPSLEARCSGSALAAGEDLRPWLGDTGTVRELLVSQSIFWDEAIDLLVSDHRLRDDDADRLHRHRPTSRHCPHPRALVFHRCYSDIRTIHWGERSVRSSLAFFRGGSLRQVRAAVTLVEKMMAEGETAGALVQGFLLRAPAAVAAPWLRLAGQVRKPDRRRDFIERLLLSPVLLRSPHRIPIRLLQRLEARVRWPGSCAAEWEQLFALLRYGVDAAILEDGLDLLEALGGPSVGITLPQRPCVRVDLEPLIDLGRRLLVKERGTKQFHYGSASRLILDLWEAALVSRELRRILASSFWNEFPSESHKEWVRLLLALQNESEKGNSFRPLLDRIRISVRQVPVARQARKLTALRLLLSAKDPSSFEDYESLASTVAAGFSEVPHRGIWLFEEFYLKANRDQRWSLAGLSRAALKHLEDATRSGVDWERIENAAKEWFRLLPEADLRIHFRRPGMFIETLNRLGDLPAGDVSAILGHLREHPGFCLDPLRIDPRDACLLFDTVLRPGQDDPVPRKLRDLACGRVSLGMAALAHYREEFAGRLAAYQIGLLREEIARVEDRYRSEQLDPHTIRFLTTLGKSNRRGFKRFLQAIRQGDREYRDAHPANQSWLQRHHGLSLDSWILPGSGAFHLSLSDVEGASIQLEDDPQEELKMGTCVDTCLGLGGCNQHAVVANTLDINKRVAYLRDRSGLILARQLLAISEAEELVPFSVYRTPVCHSNREVERAFLEFDQEMAKRLGIPLRAPGGSYEILPLVVTEWYDDRAWELEVC